LKYGTIHGALAVTTLDDTSTASLTEVEKIISGGCARVIMNIKNNKKNNKNILLSKKLFCKKKVVKDDGRQIIYYYFRKKSNQRQKST
jgi:hypothetical protein